MDLYDRYLFTFTVKQRLTESSKCMYQLTYNCTFLELYNLTAY